MYLPLQLATVALFLLLSFFLGKSREKLPHLAITCLSMAFAFLLWHLLPFPSDTLTITATGNKNEDSKGTRISLLQDPESFEALLEGKWNTEETLFTWEATNDQNRQENYTKAIQIEIPYGTNRKLSFVQNDSSGKVRVAYNGNTEIIDLYAVEEGTKTFSLVDTDLMLLHYTKLMRLLTWFLTAMGCEALCLALIKKGKITGKVMKNLGFALLFLGNLWMWLTADGASLFGVYSVYIYKTTLILWVVSLISYVFSKETKESEAVL